jgi:hypothetical protein
MSLLQTLGSAWLRRRMGAIERATREPVATQARVLRQLLAQVEHTAFGRQHGLTANTTLAEYQRRVPVQPYEALYPWIERALRGEADVLWPGRTTWFSKSSGTTNDRSKFIPMTPASLRANHYQLGQDMLAMYMDARPDSRLFEGQSLSVGGSHELAREGPHARTGDLSAVLIENMPAFFERFRAPRRATALLPHWETKVDVMAREVLHSNIVSAAGVPTWMLILLRHLAELGHSPTLGPGTPIWPNFELVIHGGVSFTPYRELFKSLLPSERVHTIETYNASEGFFAVQYQRGRPDLLLMLDYGIFYEFIPLDELGSESPRVLTLGEVEVGPSYAVVISTNGGLWRYAIGDTVRFTGRDPYTLVISGRTKSFINAFGEELVVENAEVALAEACVATGAIVADYTAGPIFFAGAGAGGHEWVIEFERAPSDQAQFNAILDATLQQVNTDYEAKRRGNLALSFPVIHVPPQGTFYAWLKQRGKLGGQNKVPRLANERTYVESLLELLTLV